ncbi:hypothetical protein KSF_010160 [Reticulibacter mediterranei]|uniref:Uncharacterized protein n=1 Tax=Reticulibacter mediterranei TaxID=2778369 RepID=A0A8J3MZZ6_9CHLR|nr:hypothetical protein KSF_010160 [Reticulibacter mediterranei]
MLIHVANYTIMLMFAMQCSIAPLQDDLKIRSRKLYVYDLTMDLWKTEQGRSVCDTVKAG